MDTSSTPDPRGSTLWEMFLQWKKNRSSADQTMPSSPLANPLDWTPGTPVSLNATHGPEFASALTRVEELRHVIRREAGQEFPFVDYVLRVSPRDSAPFPVRIRCLPDGGGGWHRLLLRLHDEFGFAADFLEVLNDPGGTFNVEDDSPAGNPDAAPVTVSFQRLNGITGPWHATVIRQREAAGSPVSEDGGGSGAGGAASGNDQEIKQETGSMEFWDFIHEHADGTEEFLFAEVDGSNGWTQIWRGSRVFL